MLDHPRIVLATPSWSLNGPNIFSANLARELNRLQIPAHIVITRPDWLDAKPLPKPPNIPFEILPVARFTSLTGRWKAMIRHLEQYAPCIYIPNYDFGHSCICPRLPDSVSIVGIVHSDDPQHYEHTRRLGKYWNAVVAVSKTVAAETLRSDHSLAPRLSIIPYGVTAAGSLPERSSAIDRRLRVIYAGRLDQKQKRVLDLPEIVKATANEGVLVHMNIVGSGPMEAQLRSRFAAIGATIGPVEFLGTLDSGALTGLLAHQDVFLLSSGFEGLTIGVLEAMGQGCIPLVSDIRSGVRELIVDGRNGFRVAVGDVQGFANRLAALSRNSGLRNRMLRAAYKTAQSEPYRMDHMVQSYLGLFQRVRDEARRGVFRRPAGHILPPPDLGWQEYLPGSLQQIGHYAKHLASRAVS